MFWFQTGAFFPGPKKLWEVFDQDSEKMKEIFNKEYNAALKPGGDYIHYSHVKLTKPNIERRRSLLFMEFLTCNGLSEPVCTLTMWKRISLLCERN